MIAGERQSRTYIYIIIIIFIFIFFFLHINVIATKIFMKYFVTIHLKYYSIIFPEEIIVGLIKLYNI